MFAISEDPVRNNDLSSSQFSPFRYFPNFSDYWKHWLPVWHHVHIWQVSPQLSCVDTWQIWKRLKVFNLYFCWIEISSNGDVNKRSFSNPHYINQWWLTIDVYVRHQDLKPPKCQNVTSDPNEHSAKLSRAILVKHIFEELLWHTANITRLFTNHGILLNLSWAFIITTLARNHTKESHKWNPSF